LPAGGASGATTLSITTTTRTSVLPAFRNLPTIHPLTFLWLTALGLTVVLAQKSRRAGGSGLRATPAFLMLCTLLIAGCGSAAVTQPPNPTGTPAGTYTITVTATSGSAVRSTTVTLIVQ
jgi:hypothetical protein